MAPDPTPPLIAVLGPTASGKSAAAELLAERLDLQLINADAFMVYRGFDVGTNKPTNREDYELLDIVEPTDDFGVGEWIRRAVVVLEDLWEKRRGAVVVGGTGFYVRALFEEYADLKPAPDPQVREDLERRQEQDGLEALVQDLQERAPEVALTIDLKNPVRVRRALERLADLSPPIVFKLPPFQKYKFILDPGQEQLDRDIARRTEVLLASGWKDEVREILGKGVPRTAPAFRAIGYDYVIDLIEGRLGEEEAKDRIVTSTRQYAKRQRTWLRAEPNARTLGHQSAQQTADEICNAMLSR